MPQFALHCLVMFVWMLNIMQKKRQLTNAQNTMKSLRRMTTDNDQRRKVKTA